MTSVMEQRVSDIAQRMRLEGLTFIRVCLTEALLHFVDVCTLKEWVEGGVFEMESRL